MDWGIPPFSLQNVRNTSSRNLAANTPIKRYSVAFDRTVDFTQAPLNVPKFSWVKVINNGAFPLRILRIGVGKPFSIEGDKEGFLRPGDYLNVKIICTMKRKGDVEATFIVYTDVGKQFSLSVKATGVDRIGSFPVTMFPELNFVRQEFL